jgi:hypothetical protein
LAAIVYLIQAGCSWPKLPAELFGISRSTALVHSRKRRWAKKGGPSPTDRGKTGSKIHVICDRTGLPLSVLTTAERTAAS